MRRSLSTGGSSIVQWRKVGIRWRLRMCFRRLLCVRIEIDQLQCVNCWVIIHSLSVSCTKINHSRCALVIWSSLQLTSKQWIITQQFTARADLFLKYFTSLKDKTKHFWNVYNKQLGKGFVIINLDTLNDFLLRQPVSGAKMRNEKRLQIWQPNLRNQYKHQRHWLVVQSWRGSELLKTKCSF